jgi:LysR family glycine cleavage system transcriptional activator
MDSIRRLPSLNALRAFDSAARHLNFRLAAEELGVTQGAVAQMVRGLEASLALKLFDRHPRSLALTNAGRSYAASIHRAFELIADATEVVRPEPQHLTVSVTPSFASRWLIPRLPDFTARHADVDLRIVATDRLSSFQTDAVDLAVRLGRPPFGAGLNAELLFEQIVVAVAHPGLVMRLGDPTETGILRPYALLHDSHDYWPEFLSLGFRPGRDEPGHHIRFNQTSLAIEAAIAGQGLALASRFFVESDLAAGRLLRVGAAELRPGADFYLVTPRKPRRPGPLETVRSWLVEQARGEPNLRNGACTG